MQENNRSSSHFSQRTEVLAEKRGVLLRDLPAELGFSERMLFGYRSGKYPISSKAWRKLAAAERAAGIHPSTEPSPATEREHVRARDDTLSATAAQLAPLTSALDKIEARLDKIEAALRALQSPSRPRHSRK